MREITRVLCACDRRRHAQLLGDFVRLPHQRAWMFTDEASRRAMSSRARYYAFSVRAEYPHRDHTGEPYTWITCPFCQHELPGTEDVPAVSDATGDPEL